MDKKQSIAISARICRAINEEHISIGYNDKLIEEIRKEYTEDELKTLFDAGFFDGDFEKYAVIRSFTEYTTDDDCPGWYLRKLFSLSKKFDARGFEQNPYILNIKTPDTQVGNYLLTYSDYKKGEIFQYDMPEIDEDSVIPRLGFFDGAVKFPALYEGNIPWVSVCPSEINSMEYQISRAVGRTLVLGLGLGYFPYIISKEKRVESITIVEISKEIIEIFEKVILPQFDFKDKITIVHADAIEYMKNVSPEDYDYCFADIWESVDDGAPLYLKIKENESRLFKTEFTYWIEKEIKEYLGE